MKTKAFFGLLAILAIVILALGAVPANAAPAASVNTGVELGENCVLDENGEEICYEPVEPIVTQGHYGECSTLGEGWSQSPTNEAECVKTTDTSGYVPASRPWIDATYKCPEGYSGPDALGKCSMTVTAGYWETASQPVGDPGGYSCPGPFTFTDSRQVCPDNDSAYTSHDSSLPCKRKIWFQWKYAAKVTETTTVGPFSYDKSSDPNKCHLPTGVSQSVPSWARSKFNAQFPEWLDSIYTPPTYLPCSSLGGGWVDGDGEHQCKLWHDPVVDVTDQVIDVAAHYGSCSALGTGWEEDPGDESKCRKWSESSTTETVARPWIDENTVCPEGSEPDGNGGCQVEVECPIDPPVVVPTATPADPARNCNDVLWRYSLENPNRRSYDPTNPPDLLTKCQEWKRNKMPNGAGVNWTLPLIALGLVIAAILTLALKRRTN